MDLSVRFNIIFGGFFRSRFVFGTFFLSTWCDWNEGRVGGRIPADSDSNREISLWHVILGGELVDDRVSLPGGGGGSLAIATRTYCGQRPAA